MHPIVYNTIVIQEMLRLIPRMFTKEGRHFPACAKEDALIFGVPTTSSQAIENAIQHPPETTPTGIALPPIEDRIWPHRVKAGLKRRSPEATVITKNLLSWANTLPLSPYGIIDLAAGQGNEAFFLNQFGHTCIANDASELMVAHSFVPEIAREEAKFIETNVLPSPP